MLSVILKRGLKLFILANIINPNFYLYVDDNPKDKQRRF